MEKVLPKLRFPEFQDNWKENKLSQIAKFSKGKGISKSDIDENGKIECVRYGELYTHYKETINEVKSKTNLSKEELIFSEENDVIIPASGETQLDIATASCVTRSGIALGGDLNIIKSKANGVFLSYYLNSKKKIDIAKLAQGISVVHLYSSQLGLLKINLPNSEEQQKIATFLTSVDERLSLLAQQKGKLELYKKGIMQQIFSQKLRFKDENGNNYPDWEEKKLGELNIYVSDGNYGEMYPKSKELISEGIPFIRANNIKNKSLVWDDMKYISNNLHSILTSGHLKTNDVLVTTRGDIGLLAYVKEEFNNSNINAQICLLRADNITINSNYLIQILSYEKINNQFKSLQTGSALKQLPKSSLAKIIISLPIYKEQQKIASFLSAIDVQIEGVSKKIEQTKWFKKGLLQQMFV